MERWQIKTPVVFIIFNRPDTTEKVFEEIRRAKPPRLLVIADGPRLEKPGEAEKCRAARAIIQRVDWECEVLTNYSDMNLGCKRRVSTGLNWVFDTVEEAIILEDDCLPDPSFFRFCEDLLEKYRHHERISCISGDNFQFGKNQTDSSYYYSRYCHVWGWATWRRAWKKYDVKMARWPEIRQSKALQGWLGDGPLADFWEGVFDHVYHGKIDTWDFQWVHSSWSHNMLTILPGQNLISNIGFREDATHTKGQSLFADMETTPVQFPLKHPSEIIRHAAADSNTEKMMFLPQPVSGNSPGPKNDADMACKICSSRSKFLKNAMMLNIHSVDYFLCEQCGFIQTEDPYWLKEAYSDAITSSDTGLVRRNVELSKMCRLIISNHFEKSGKFVDYGGGYGLFVRLMRDYGFDFYWLDQHCSNLFAKTFEADTKKGLQYDLLTAFEVFEHLVNPMEEIEKMLKFSKTIFFSTELVPANNPKPGEWWYFGLEHGQHISFYTVKSLDSIAKKFNLNLYSNGTTLHILTDKVLKTPLEFSESIWGLIPVKNIEWFGPHKMERVTDDSHNIDEFNDLGVIAFQQGKYELAAECFLKALAVKPDFAVAHNNLGVAFKELGQRNEAKVCYEMAIALKPDYAEARANLNELSGQSAFEPGSLPAVSLVMEAGELSEDMISSTVLSVLNQTCRKWTLEMICEENRKSTIPNHLRKDGRLKITYYDRKEERINLLNKILSSASGEFVLLLNPLELAPNALSEIAQLTEKDPEIDFIYSDGDKISSSGEKVGPSYKPAWSPDYLLSYNYIGRFLVIKKSLFKQLGGFKSGYDGAEEYEFLLRATDQNRKIAHIPAILYHNLMKEQSNLSIESQKKAISDSLKRRGVAGEVHDTSFPGIFRVKYEITRNKKVSIIIPTKDKVEILEKCIQSILNKTTYKDYEILVVNNQSSEPKTYDYFKKLKANPIIKVLNYNRPFNFSKINNFTVSQSTGFYIVFLNNDTEVISGDWLSAMIEFGQKKNTGIVGARLLYPDKTIQHAGIIIAKGAVALGFCHSKYPGDNAGYEGRVMSIHNLSAVTGACMLMRKELFEEAGGFDEQFAVNFNDIALCVKIRQKGYQVIYTPFAELYHHECLSRGQGNSPEKIAEFNREQGLFVEKWGHAFAQGDPFSNANL